jgi:hypothetical protein
LDFFCLDSFLDFSAFGGVSDFSFFEALVVVDLSAFFVLSVFLALLFELVVVDEVVEVVVEVIVPSACFCPLTTTLRPSASVTTRPSEPETLLDCNKLQPVKVSTLSTDAVASFRVYRIFINSMFLNEAFYLRFIVKSAEIQQEATAQVVVRNACKTESVYKANNFSVILTSAISIILLILQKFSI